MTTYFPTLSVDEQADTLARLLPDGPLFDAKWRDQTTMRKLLLGLAGEFARLDGTMADILAEYDPRTTNLFLEEWERAVAIPDHCFDGKGDVDLRRHFGPGPLPRSGAALERLVELESGINEQRRARNASYSSITHVDVLIAMMGEARIMRTSQLGFASLRKCVR